MRNVQRSSLHEDFLSKYSDTLQQCILPEGQDKIIAEILCSLTIDPTDIIEFPTIELMARAISYRYNIAPYHNSYSNLSRMMFLVAYIKCCEVEFPRLVKLMDTSGATESCYAIAITQLKADCVDCGDTFPEELLGEMDARFLLKNLLVDYAL